MMQRFLSIFVLVSLVSWGIPQGTLALEFSAEAQSLIVGFETGETTVVRLAESDRMSDAIIRLQAVPGVKFVEPNYRYQIAAFPSDPLYGNQGYLAAITVRDAWSKALLQREVERTITESLVAVIDTGVAVDHPDLVQAIWVNPSERAGDGIDNDRNGYIDDVSGWDFVDDDNRPVPEFTTGFEPAAVQHGTIVSGLVAATALNQEGIVGVSWSTKILPLRVLDSFGSGEVGNVVQAIDYAIAVGADVINMSFVGSDFSQAFADAIERAHARGVIVVAAAGNTSTGTDGDNLDADKRYPVCYDTNAGTNSVIGVSSVNDGLQKSPFSNYGGCVDVSAPGENMFSTQVVKADLNAFRSPYGGGWSGTSVAAPLVSGAAALIRSVRPNLTPDQVLQALKTTALPLDASNPNYKGKLGSGLIQVAKALDVALGQRPPVVSGGKKNYVVAGLGFGSFPQVRILETTGVEYKSFFAYAPTFGGAIEVATGDLDGDGRDEIVTAPSGSGGPHIRILNTEGQVIRQFFAFDQRWRGGAHVAVGDVTGDGKAEIVVGAGKGNGPQVRVYSGEGVLLSQFFAYGTNFLGGVNVAVGSFGASGMGIVTGAGTGGGPHVRVFTFNGELRSQFFAFNSRFSGGVDVAVGDVTGDGVDEIVTSIERAVAPEVRIFTEGGTQTGSFFAFEPNSTGGVSVAVGDIENDGTDEVIAGRATGAADVRVFSGAGVQQAALNAYVNATYRGGVRPAVIRY